ncbi:hypothetical protein K488DRAFT_42640 [Vararia minispora EC-137]|uniref:Uncharacterized protein n=1 Tax=Vararia minispora EC-137 TaxID=1314806 RepID=A0ACB8QUW0_9AGAM|nr:hypothetical protein K488DRAFT_42640 [Vararia minispora EC-137]
MLPFQLWLLSSSILVPWVAAGLHSLPEDPYAFPKYRVSFLNGLPLLNDTAEKWLHDGLRGGEAEFLNQPWADAAWRAEQQIKEIGSGQQDVREASANSWSPYRLEVMKLGPRNSYLCFIPPPPEDSSHPPPEEVTEVTALHSWSLLQPLAGSCIYHRQGWFTYAYCHNSHVRQFRETFRPRLEPPGTFATTGWEAYDLGRAPAPPEDMAIADIAVAERAALGANLELARGAGSRYLVQRWSDGTYCDKAGRRREIEVQFHCSMTMTDTILFVKETKTCSYVLVINTPRLCSEPGFKSRLDQRGETMVRCRQVVDTAGLASANPQLPESESPIQVAHPKPILPPPGTEAQATPKKVDNGPVDAASDSISSAIQTAIQDMLRRAGFSGSADEVPGTVVVEDAGGGEMVVEFLSEIDLNNAYLEEIEYDLPDTAEGQPVLPNHERVVEALRAAGYDVIPDRNAGKGNKNEDDEEERSTKGKKPIGWPGQGARVEL